MQGRSLRDAYGRSTGFTYARNGTVLHTVSTGYGPEGKIYTAGIMHGGEQKSFGFGYLFGTPLINNVTMPNGMVLSKSYEEKRDLLTEMLYKRNTVEVAKRSYTYDNLSRPVTRVTQREGSSAVTDNFAYNAGSELSSSTGVDYTYDTIGNRRLILTGGVSNVYTTNQLNQYTVIHSAQYGMLEPEYDRAGNQTKLRTAKGTWNVTYDANSRPAQFTSGNGSTVIDCTYDYMGRRNNINIRKQKNTFAL